MPYIVKHLLTLEWDVTTLTIPWYVYKNAKDYVVFAFERKGGEFELFRPAIETWLHQTIWKSDAPQAYAVAMKNILGYQWVYVRPGHSLVPLEGQFTHILQLPTAEPVDQELPFERHRLNWN